MGLWFGGVVNKTNLSYLNLDMHGMGLRCGGAVRHGEQNKRHARTHVHTVWPVDTSTPSTGSSVRITKVCT
jgi:hypothetical protein